MVDIVKYVVITIALICHVHSALALIDEAAEKASASASVDEGRANREKRHLRFPYNSCFALAVVLAIPIKLTNRNVYMSYNFETNYYLPYFDNVQGLVPIPWTTIDEPGVNSGTVLAYQTNIPPRGRILGNEAADIVDASNSTSSSGSNSTQTLPIVELHSNSTVKITQKPKIGDGKSQPKKVDKKPKVDAKEEASSAQGNATVSKPSNSSEVNKHKVKRAILSTLLSRKKFYKILNHKLEASGLNGDACLLKTICETSHSPVGEVNGVLGDIVHVLFSPSSSRDENLPLRYYEAEQNGQLKMCKRYDYDCPTGIYDLISMLK